MDTVYAVVKCEFDGAEFSETILEPLHEIDLDAYDRVEELTISEGYETELSSLSFFVRDFTVI